MTFNRTFPFVLAVSLGISAVPASAQNVDDVRCLLASNAAAKVAKDSNEKRLAEAALHFYLGRIDGKFSPSQLAAAFAAQLKSLTGANLGPTMQSCFQHAQERMKFVQSVGERMSRPARLRTR